MTRPLVATLAATLILGVAATAPDPIAEAAIVPARTLHKTPGRTPFDLRLGDGIFRLLIRGCDACDTSLTIEIKLPNMFRAFFPPLTTEEPSRSVGPWVRGSVGP